MVRKLFAFYALFFAISVSAQTTIKGRVTEAGSNIGLPYVNIFFKGTLEGTVTDFEGNYFITTSTPTDSIFASYLGYKTRAKKVKAGKVQNIDFQMLPGSLSLATIVVRPGENPAIPIIRKAIDNKARYNPERLNSLSYESYYKQEIDIDNLSDKTRKRKIFKKFTNIFDNMDSLAGEDSKANLPVALMEILSEVSVQKDPAKKREEVIAAKMNFVGMKDGNVASQLTGADFNNFNFFNDYVTIARKDFMSPISNGAVIFYNYELLDSLYIGGNHCYKLAVKPKNKNDLAFTGTIWIEDSSFALKRLDLEITKDVNINFVSRIKIHEELANVGDSAYIPYKTKILVNYLQFSDKFASLLIKIYNSNKNFKVNQKFEDGFFERQETFKEDFLLKDSAFWIQNRHEALKEIEKESYHVIDTIRSIPAVKAGVGALYFLATGYTSNTGPVEFGPYMLVYGWNPIEGDRFRLGFRTNVNFSKEWVIRGYAAYGLRDEKLKYNMQVERILDHTPWLKTGVQVRHDLDQAGVNYEFSRNGTFSGPSASLYGAASQIAEFSGYVRKREYRSWIEGQLRRGLTGRISLANVRGFPLGNYSTVIDSSFLNATSEYVTSEIAGELRFSPAELFVQNGNERFSIGNPKKPVLTLAVNHSLKGVLGSTISYTRLSAGISQKIRMGMAGYSQYNMRAGKVFSKVPFNLMEIPRGNETFFFSGGVFNLMNYAEFAADQQVTLFYQHHFQGLLFNRIPLLNKAHLREVVTLNTFYGSLSGKNSYINDYRAFSELKGYPYAETAIGIENIFKFIRVDFIYRLSYNSNSYFEQYKLSHPEQSIGRYGLKFSIQVNL